MQNPWITNGIKKFSMPKQCLYEKFSKYRNEKSELEYKIYKRLLESIKGRSNKLHFSNVILKYQHNIKKIREVIKESIGKGKCNHRSFLKKIKADGKKLKNNLILILQRLDLNLFDIK